MDAGAPPTVCPSCGTGDEAHTIQQLFDLLNGVQDEARQQAEQLRQAPPPTPPPQRDADDLQNPAQQEPSQQIANLVLGTAAHLIGKAIGRRLNRTYEERISPALEQASHAAEQSRQEQAAIIERHPDPRGCMRDQVLFVVGGTRVTPFTDVMPITEPHADELVNALRAP